MSNYLLITIYDKLVTKLSFAYSNLDQFRFELSSESIGFISLNYDSNLCEDGQGIGLFRRQLENVDAEATEGRDKLRVLTTCQLKVDRPAINLKLKSMSGFVISIQSNQMLTLFKVNLVFKLIQN
jgi:hypothetical protein